MLQVRHMKNPKAQQLAAFGVAGNHVGFRKRDVPEQALRVAHGGLHPEELLLALDQDRTLFGLGKLAQALVENGLQQWLQGHLAVDGLNCSIHGLQFLVAGGQVPGTTSRTLSSSRLRNRRAVMRQRKRARIEAAIPSV